VVLAENLHGILQALAVLTDVGLVLEAIDDTLLFRFVLGVVHDHLHVDLKHIDEGMQHLHKLLLVDELEALLEVRLHLLKEVCVALLQLRLNLQVVRLLEIADPIEDVIDFLDEDLAQVVLGVRLNVLVLAHHAVVGEQGRLLFLLTEQHAAHPLVLDVLERRLEA